MPENDTLTYHGFAVTESWGNPVLASAPTPEAADRAKRESSGGLIFLTPEEMPTLTQLLESGEIRTLVLEGELPFTDEAAVPIDEASEPIVPDWRSEARRRLAFNLDIADRDDVMDEQYTFLAALPESAIEGLLRRADEVLDDLGQPESAWTEFLDDEAARAFEHLSHDPIPLQRENRYTAARSEHEWEPLLTVANVGVPFTRGALGGPRPLVDLTED